MCSVAVLSPGPSLTFTHRVNNAYASCYAKVARASMRAVIKVGPGLWTLMPPAVATRFDFVPPSRKGISWELGHILQESSPILGMRRPLFRMNAKFVTDHEDGAAPVSPRSLR